MLSGATSPGGEELLTVTVVRDEHGYGMKVSGDNPVYVQSVKEHGAAWRAGLRSGDRILRVESVPVHHHTHQQVVQMIRANPTTVLTVQQNSSRHKTPITGPVPVNPEKQRQLEVSKVHTMRLMLEQEQKYIRDLRNELSKVPDVRKQTQLESAEQRCSTLQQQIDTIMAGQSGRREKAAPGFLSGLPRSLSNLTGQSLRNLRQARARNEPQPSQPSPPLLQPTQHSQPRQSDRRHNNTVPLTPTTCLDNSPPPLPPRSQPKLTSSWEPKSTGAWEPKPMGAWEPRPRPPMPTPEELMHRSSQSLDGDCLDSRPNSIAMQMSYPLVNAPPPPLQTDLHANVPVLHIRSRSSPEQLDHDLAKSVGAVPTASSSERDVWTAPPGTPPPPYRQPCIDPQRAIISMEEDDSPASDNSTYSGLFSNLRTVRESKARTAVLLNWLLGERRCACSNLLLILTDAYRSAAGVPTATLRRWAYEIHSTFLIPDAVLKVNGVDENMVNEIDHVLVNEYEKEELLRNVFRKARQKAKDELAQQLEEFQVKRQVGLGTLYGPSDAVIQRCHVDKAQEQVVVERLLCAQLSNLGSSAAAGGVAVACADSSDARQALHCALLGAAHALHCRPASVAAVAGGGKAAFLQRDKLYKLRLKQLAKHRPNPYVVRGHHLQAVALTAVAHCHHCQLVMWGLAPQAYVCADCKLRVHRTCARYIEESCCLDGEHHNNRISRFMERIHTNQPNNLDFNDKKSRKISNTSHFLNMEKSMRKLEDEQPWDQPPAPASSQGEAKREGSADELAPADAEPDPGDAAKEAPDKDNNSWRGGGGRGVNRAESCRERDAPRRGKHRNASDPNRLTAHNNHDLEPGAATAPSGSSSSSSLSSRSNESNTVPAEQQASQSEWSDEEEPLAAQWADSVPQHELAALRLTPRQRKRQEVIHELIVSEGSHVRWLKVLCRVFLRPLSTSSLLSAEELRALFPNLPQVRDVHVAMHTRLRGLRYKHSVVPMGEVATIVLHTLGDPSYASCVSKFCGGQRMALESLRERRRKNKELHQFLASREQLPLCGRLQLRDLLACVWQRLTKYRLLLESLLKTASEEDDPAEDIALVQRALDDAKGTLHTVDAAIRTAENEHRLRSIQAKLEVRAGSEWEELKGLDLCARQLRLEGELNLRLDGHKKTSTLALMFEDMLVLLIKESDKFVLRPLAHHQHGPLSPLIKWDKVLFRPNAAVRNTFFLMNINGVQMHELSANTAAEYTTWVQRIQEAPLARVELRTAAVTRTSDEAGVNVSRNPSDASEKSTLTSEETESDKDRQSAERACDRDADSSITERDRDDSIADKEEERLADKEDSMLCVEKEDSKQIPRRPTLGRVSTHSPGMEPELVLCVLPPPASHTALVALTHQERLRRLDLGIQAALRAKSRIVSAVLGLPASGGQQMAELAVAEALGHVDVASELRNTRPLSDEGETEGEREGEGETEVETREEDCSLPPDLRTLLLAAHAQASQLTELISKALTVDEAAVVAARSRRGRCDHCARRQAVPVEPSGDTPALVDSEAELDKIASSSMDMLSRALEDENRDSEDVEGDIESEIEGVASAASLASRAALLAGGVSRALGAALATLPVMEAHSASVRASLAALREDNHRLRTRDYQRTDEIYLLKPDADQPLQDHASNGG